MKVRTLSIKQGLRIFAATLLIATTVPQFFGAHIASATGDGGYPWVGATTLNTSTGDYGYTTCPSNDTGCFSYTNPTYSGYGEGDPWVYGLRNCTSYVAWEIAQQFPGTNISGWGNATTWDTNAAAHYTVYNGAGHQPVVGEIAQWDNADGGLGHVAYVGSVSGSVATLWEYNAANTGVFSDTRTTTTGGVNPGVPDHYIHIGTLGSSSYADGQYLSVSSGPTYIVAGGAAVRVWSWSDVGGSHTTTPVTQATIDAMPKTPSDGTYVYQYGNSAVYLFTGGAPVPVHSYASVGGTKPTVMVPTGALALNFPPYPADGTYVIQYGSAPVYEFAGGSPIRVWSFSDVGGSKTTETVPDDAIPNDFPAYPAGGTYVYEYGGSAVYDFAGGEPIRVWSWSDVGGDPGTEVMIPSGAIASDFASTSADGTFVYEYGSSAVYEIIGDAPIRVWSWSDLGGAQPNSMLPSGSLSSDYATTPADYHFILEYGGAHIYETAGDSALVVSSWTDLGGAQPFSIIPSGSIAGSLLSYPANDTYIKGYGSGDEFQAESGALNRITTMPLPAAIPVDDYAIVNQLGGTE